MVDLEEMSDEELATLQEEFHRLRARYEAKPQNRGASSGGDRSRPPRT